jgi:hypothetical protein
MKGRTDHAVCTIARSLVIFIQLELQIGWRSTATPGLLTTVRGQEWKKLLKWIRDRDTFLEQCQDHMTLNRQKPPEMSWNRSIGELGEGPLVGMASPLWEAVTLTELQGGTAHMLPSPSPERFSTAPHWSSALYLACLGLEVFQIFYFFQIFWILE